MDDFAIMLMLVGWFTVPIFVLCPVMCLPIFDPLWRLVDRLCGIEDEKSARTAVTVADTNEKKFKHPNYKGL